jgi:hypothetical protein
MTASGRLAPTDHLILEQLLLGATQRQAALRVGISERTVRRRISNALFQRVLLEHQAEAVKQVRRRLTASAVGATQVLMQIAGDRAEDGHPARREGATARVAAARAVIYSFARLQPLQVDGEVAVGVPIIDYVIEGLDDPEVLR